MSNGNGVTATLSQGVETVKETAGNVGETIAHTAEEVVASVKKTAQRQHVREMLHQGTGVPGRLRHLPELWVFQVRVS